MSIDVAGRDSPRRRTLVPPPLHTEPTVRDTRAGFPFKQRSCVMLEEN
jgi:hypothetical protein